MKASLVPSLLLIVWLLPGCSPAPIETWLIQSEYAGSPVWLWTNTRVAGAIDGLQWRGTQFIDSHDHGRQLQSAVSFDGLGECLNPTQAGSRRDGTGLGSSSRLMSVEARGNQIRSKTQMAYWLAPGQRSPHCGPGPGTAKNDAVISKVILESVATISDNAIRHDVTYVLQRDYESATFEALTAYLPIRFSAVYGVDPASGQLRDIGPGPGEQSLPVILATQDGRFALGVTGAGARFGRWLFPDVSGPTSKWNCVFRKRQVRAGRHSFSCASIFGTLDDVRRTIVALQVQNDEDTIRDAR